MHAFFLLFVVHEFSSFSHHFQLLKVVERELNHERKMNDIKEAQRNKRMENKTKPNLGLPVIEEEENEDGCDSEDPFAFTGSVTVHEGSGAIIRIGGGTYVVEEPRRGQRLCVPPGVMRSPSGSDVEEKLNQQKINTPQEDSIQAALAEDINNYHNNSSLGLADFTMTSSPAADDETPKRVQFRTHTTVTEDNAPVSCGKRRRKSSLMEHVKAGCGKSIMQASEDNLVDMSKDDDNPNPTMMVSSQQNLSLSQKKVS